MGKIRVFDPDPVVLKKALAAFNRNPEFADVEIAEAWAGRIDATPNGVPLFLAPEVI